MKNNLKIAIPNKGRLEQDTQKIFSSHNMEIIRNKGDRDYRGKILELAGVDIVFLSPKEITLELLKGSIDLGITGLDLVHENIYDEFLEKFTNEVSKITVGNGLEDGIVSGPLIDQSSLEKVIDHVQDAVNTGAKIAIGGDVHSLGGNFYQVVDKATNNYGFFSSYIN